MGPVACVCLLRGTERHRVVARRSSERLSNKERDERACRVCTRALRDARLSSAGGGAKIKKSTRRRATRATRRVRRTAASHPSSPASQMRLTARENKPRLSSRACLFFSLASAGDATHGHCQTTPSTHHARNRPHNPRRHRRRRGESGAWASSYKI